MPALKFFAAGVSAAVFSIYRMSGSSHYMPTPRGGGVIIVVVSLAFYVFITLFLTKDLSSSFVLGAILVAGISWLGTTDIPFQSCSG